MIKHLAGISLCKARRRRARARVLASAVATPAEIASRESQSQSATCPMNAACAQAWLPSLTANTTVAARAASSSANTTGRRMVSLGSRPHKVNKATWRANAASVLDAGRVAGMRLCIGAILPLLQLLACQSVQRQIELEHVHPRL